MNRISIGFFLKLKAKDIKHPIYLRMIYQRKKTEYFIGYRCLTNEWDELKEEHVYDTHINRSIAKIKDKIYDAFHQLNLEGNEFDVTDIKDIALGKKTKKVKLNSFFNLFIEEYKNFEKVTPYTIKKYEQTLTRILVFQEQKNKQINLSDCDLSFITDFDSYLKAIKWNKNGNRLRQNTISKYHSLLKTVFEKAVAKGLITNNPYRSFKLKFEESPREFLSMEELKKIIELNLTKETSIDYARDIFIFSCFSGFRFSDAQDLKEENTYWQNGKLFCRIHQGKTNRRLEIPILNNAVNIIKKYSSHPFRLNEGFILPRLSNQNVNKNLKIIAYIIGTKKAITHHIARHTFATTVLLENEVSLYKVSAWLGHSNQLITEVYAKVTANSLAKETEKIETSIGL